MSKQLITVALSAAIFPMALSFTNAQSSQKKTEQKKTEQKSARQKETENVDDEAAIYRGKSNALLKK